MVESESLFSGPTCDPTQRLRGNPITLNLYIYKELNIYIITDQKNILRIKVSNLINNTFISKLLMALKFRFFKFKFRKSSSNPVIQVQIPVVQIEIPIIQRVNYSFSFSSLFSHNCLPKLICSEKHHNPGSYSKAQDAVNRYPPFK